MPKKIDLQLAEILVEKKLITRENVAELLLEADRLKQDLRQVLVKHSLFSEQAVLDLLAEKLKLTCVNLKELSIDRLIINKVPLKIASYYKFIPLFLKGRTLTIAVAYPLDIMTLDEIRTQLGLDIETALACAADVADDLKKYYGLAADTLEKINSQQVSTSANDQQSRNQEGVEDIEKQATDASVIKLVNQIILEAWRKRATDIHIEPYRQGLALRYRIDGLLYDANIPGEIKNFMNAIISRIKIMSNLNIVERRLPQDGRAIVRVQDQVLDLRISTIPTPFGESLVIRILPTQMLFSLEKLGLSKNELQIFEGLVQKPHGIIFVTGPTGSGKTTTLYACLSRINTKDRKIITIEDPIEYEMSGITQIQVQPEIGLDFARGLRSILRHDPDVIMVGEVRDFETAETAIRVALTGHLVFSSVHTNDAASGIARLQDIGVEPYLIASSVEAFIAQRLIRVICPECRFEDKQAPLELRELIARDLGIKLEEVKIFRGKGCPHCNSTGYFGRTAIYEILIVDELTKEMILKKASSDQIKRLAVSKGMRTLRQDGWRKTIAGVTTFEEVIRVTSAEEEVSIKKDTSTAESSYPYQEANPEPGTLSRRVYRRLDKQVNVSYKVFEVENELIKRKDAVEEATASKNISAGGLLFVAKDKLIIGSILELKIQLPNSDELIECLARVVRVEELIEQREYDVAVCFLDLTGAERIRLDKFVGQKPEGRL
ncbi:MAG TPA: ATPase, T2SS/T4P/T4SS family [Candidatus Omnitrophota bacterium]|nr:ATPase, T2SS/T4P/T4SS family [Candidatus Omnitrophota bacterium]HPT39475.1 ATPase, T2SS/T4P/T4SS family [Candidatus Omnitrophota bacterium]